MKGITHISKLCLIVILALLPMMGGAQVFKHYKGIANKAGDYEVIDAAKGCLRQKTHECHYYVPVADAEGSTVNLLLPISKFSSTSGGDALEPRGYFRWYNYDTDYKSENIAAAVPSTSLLKEMNDANGKSKGLKIGRAHV